MGIWVYWSPRSVAIGLPQGYIASLYGYMGNKASLYGNRVIRPPSMGIWVYSLPKWVYGYIASLSVNRVIRPP